MTDVDVSSWLVVGARVAYVSGSARHGSEDVTEVTVEKVGKRDVILSNGERFNVTKSWAYDGVKWLHRHESGAWDFGNTLGPLDSPRVRQIRAARRRADAAYEVRVAFDVFDRRPDVESAQVLRDAADVFLTLLEFTSR